MSGVELDESTRDYFDGLLEQVIDQLPARLGDLLQEVPVVVEDCPSKRLMRELEIERPGDLCGLHTGIPLTERSVEHSGVLPNTITLYRLGVLQEARSLSPARRNERRLVRQIRITLLHEMGHYFGLDEDDLRELGYG